MNDDPKQIVRDGYNAAWRRYEEAFDAEGKYAAELAELTARLPRGAAVLDVGCGSGVPVARALAASGHRVTGVDISERQIDAARRNVPGAAFVRADITSLALPAAAFDAVAALYSLIHLPLEEQPPLLGRIAASLRPGGALVCATGHAAWTGGEADWLGSGAPMWWSQADAATYREWITGAGLVVEREVFVPEGEGGHALFWAARPRA
ncbi:class I SAM-dependent methyltransferase [Glycomyces tarimensis]